MRNANKRDERRHFRSSSAHRLPLRLGASNPWPLTPGPYLRRGISLLEVLISFFILLVGVVCVIVLFPVGVLNVQESVKDTRSTITALEAQSLVLGMGWLDDPYLLRPPHQGIMAPPTPPTPSPFGQPNPQGGAGSHSPTGGDPRGIDPNTTPPRAGTRPSNDIYGTSPNFIFAPNVNNVYATIMNADGTAPTFPQTPIAQVGQRFHPMAGAGIGFPIYVDPQLANAPTFQFDSANPMPTPTGSPMYKRIPISIPVGPTTTNLGGAPYVGMTPFAGNLNDLVIHSLSEVQYQQSVSPTTSNPTPDAGVTSRRDQFIRQHFFVQDELHTESTTPTAPYNPNRFQGTPLPGWRYVRSADSASPTNPESMQPPAFTTLSASVSQTFSTASRNDAYTWSFVVRNRNLQTQPANGPPQPDGSAGPSGFFGAGGPYLVPKPNDYSNDNISVLVYHKRATGRCYQLVRGCLFNGSAAMTLCWDPTISTEAPSIRRGTWIMETTLSPGLRDSTKGPPTHAIPNQQGPAALPPTDVLTSVAAPLAPASGYVKYRHAIEFYRVASVQEPVLSQTDGQMYQVVNLEQPVTGYPISHVLGDGRALPDLYTDTNATFSGLRAYPNYLPGTALQPSGSAPYAAGAGTVEAVWVPIVVMHGLQEVFSVRN